MTRHANSARSLPFFLQVVKHAEGQEAWISPANQVRRVRGHPERGRIDFLVCSGAGVKPTAKKFGVGCNSLRNHVAKHISQSYRDAVRSGPLQSEEQLRRLVAELGAGVIENLKAIYSGLASRWLHAFEAGDDHKLST